MTADGFLHVCDAMEMPVFGLICGSAPMVLGGGTGAFPNLKRAPFAAFLATCFTHVPQMTTISLRDGVEFHGDRVPARGGALGTRADV